MKQILLICSFMWFYGCSNRVNQVNHKSNVEIANEFIDAFYSFNRDSLLSTLSFAKKSQPRILYYQKWAECGNYKIIRRHDCILKNDSVVICPVTVSDDLIGALGINFNVTDTFRLIIRKGQIRWVKTSSNDPELYHQAKKWVKQNRPELIKEPCRGIREGGPTPCECVRAMIKGFEEFKASK
ncbi:MAG TPA: hypothetical protein VHO72_10445 [Bacteroidales bacterium]|nr:hypothetical protein [Bacteroidales bacterium]